MSSILWLEDQGEDLVEMLAKVTHAGYEVALASDIARALHHLAPNGPHYDWLVVDLRMQPGDNREWSLYGYNLSRSSPPVRLGLDLLRSMFVPREKLPRELPKVERPSWVTEKNTGILTVESFEDTAVQLKAVLGDDVRSRYVSKNVTQDPSGQLLELVRRLEGQ